MRRRRDPDAFGLQDLLAEAVRSLSGRPARLLLMTVGTVLGIGSLVLTYGLAQTTAGELRRQLDPSQATHFVVAPQTARDSSGESRPTAAFPDDAEQRASRLTGVTAAGLLTEVPTGDARITTVPVNDPSAAETLPPVVFSATPGLFDAVGAHVTTGRTFDAGHSARKDRVAVLGMDAAAQLGLARVDRQPTVFIGTLPYTVVGILDRVEQRSDLLGGVIVPETTARRDFAAPSGDELHLRVARGLGPLVEHQVPIALSPNSPGDFRPEVLGGSQRAAKAQADTTLAFLLLGLVSLLAGALGIVNVTALSVKERSGEIGLRRALGATSRAIAAQFMVETGAVGVVGGLAGTAIGVGAVVVIALTQGWSPAIEPWTAFAAPALGTAIGLVAGVYPALRAARIEPADALRTGV
ncbi:ABC transporter permease [Leifsonia virtsii]|uniref:ABC transporter permease n=1 Tax=Leifsonia virtsii TaxID=3035915 RepID=A0ABT8ISN8_9MICO|nr:ABC transporter permease [Leifsonia virtsii]MDN4595818.1 ABC transporter permease [Leifsonia virtsii]